MEPEFLISLDSEFQASTARQMNEVLEVVRMKRGSDISYRGLVSLLCKSEFKYKEFHIQSW